MSKLKTGIIASIATLGATAAGIAGVAMIPSIKEKVSVSINDKHVYGSEQSFNSEKLESELAAEKAKVAELTALKIKNEQAIAELMNSKAEMQIELEDLTAEIEENKETVTNLENEITAKETEIQAKQEAVNTLNSQIEANNARIAELEEQGLSDSEEIANLTTANNNLNSQITGLNNDISTLNADKEALTSAVNQLQTQITGLNNTIAGLNDTISSLQSDLDLYSMLNFDLENEIVGLNSQISNLQSEINRYQQLLENYVVVTYNIDGVETIQIQDKNSTIDFAEPTKEGFTFKGWSLTEGGEVIDVTTTISEDTILYAVFKEPTYTFTLGNVSYEFLDGMTFRDWVNSEYNVDNFFLGFGFSDILGVDSYLTKTDYDYYKTGSNSIVLGNMFINKNAVYEEFFVDLDNGDDSGYVDIPEF